MQQSVVGDSDVTQHWNYDFRDARTMGHLLRKALGRMEVTQERGFVLCVTEQAGQGYSRLW